MFQFIFFSFTKYIVWTLKILWRIGFKLSLILNLVLFFVWNNCRLRYMNLKSFFSVRVYIWCINDCFVRDCFCRRLCRHFNSSIFQFFMMIWNSVYWQIFFNLLYLCFLRLNRWFIGFNQFLHLIRNILLLLNQLTQLFFDRFFLLRIFLSNSWALNLRLVWLLRL